MTLILGKTLMEGDPNELYRSDDTFKSVVYDSKPIHFLSLLTVR